MTTTRLQYIEQIRRQVYGGQPQDDAELTINLVNQWLNQAIGVAAKANYRDNISIEGVNYVNNSFYTVFKNLSITADEQFLWKIQLPQIPLGIGAVEGISTVQIKDNSSPQISYPVIMMSENQRSFSRSMRPIPNKVIGYPEGEFVFIQSTLILNDYTAQVTMISGGDNTNLNSTLNVPDDYIPEISKYMQQQLILQRNQPVDLVPDGNDQIKSV